MGDQIRFPESNRMGFMKIVGIGLMVVSITFASEEDLTVGNRKFSVKLFREVVKNKPNENLIFSPLTLQILMALLTSATNNHGAAIQEIISTVELPSTKSNIERQFKSIMTELRKSDDDFKFLDANKIYFNPECTLQPWFTDIVRDTYKADIALINFQDPINAASTINNWVLSRTDNKITNFINPQQIPWATRIMAINALYLTGKWRIPFQAHKTIKEDFYGRSRTKQVDMMNIKGKTYEYYEDKQAQYLKMDLVRDAGDAEMVFVLPHQRQGLDLLIQNHLDAALFPNTFNDAIVDVSLPKFKITNELSCIPILKNLSVRQIFSSGVTLEGYNFHGYQHNYITDVFQKTLIEVEETGVRAVSTTKFTGSVDTSFGDADKVFKADHPFLFYIRVLDVIVYAGRVLEP